MSFELKKPRVRDPSPIIGFAIPNYSLNIKSYSLLTSPPHKKVFPRQSQYCPD